MSGKYLFDLSGNEKQAKKASITKLLKTIGEYGFDDSEPSNEANKLINKISNDFSKATSKKLTQITVDFDFSTIVPNLFAGKSNAKIYREIEASFVKKDGEEYCMGILDFLEEAVEKKKIIFFNIALMNYFYTKKRNDESVHSVSAILFPNKDGSYGFYYINPHGKDVHTYNEYDVNQTGKKKKTLKLKKSYEMLFVRDFLKCLRAHLRKNDVQCKIHFKETSAYVYSGANLQAGDEHGVCFLFAWLIYYYLGVFMKKGRKVVDTIEIEQSVTISKKRKMKSKVQKKITVKLASSESMILGGNLTDFVYSSVMDYDDSFKKIIIVRSAYDASFAVDLGYDTDVNESATYQGKLECVLEESESIFINRIITALLKYRTV